MTNLKLFCVTTMLLLLCNCKNTAQNKSETQLIKANTTQAILTTKTVVNAQRLTQASVLSFFPKEFLGQKYNGELYVKTSKPDSQTGAINYSYTQQYGKYGEIKIIITDFSDNQSYINTMKKYGKTEDAGEDKWSSFKIYKHASGLYFFESLKKYNNEIIKGTLVVSNPRFDIEIQTRKQRTKAYKPAVLYKELKKTNLIKLFNLPIPKGESLTIATQNSNLKTLNCDELLPVSVVQSICNKTVSIKTTSFEKEYNCNRFYPDKNSTGALIFLVTQFPANATVKSAVKLDNGEEIPNLGDLAVYSRKYEEEYLKVGYKNYVLELRSTKNFDKEGVCYTKEELIKLMKDIINRL